MAELSFPKGNLINRLLCRRYVLHPNQLRVPLARLVSDQGSLAPHRLDRRINATMSPSDATIRPHWRLWLPTNGCPPFGPWTPDRASQVPGSSFRARCLLSPRRARRVHLIEASPPVLDSPSWAGWPLPFSCNEADPSSRHTTARALAFPSFNGQDRSRPLKGRLPDSRLFVMMNTFQFTILHVINNCAC